MFDMQIENKPEQKILSIRMITHLDNVKSIIKDSYIKIKEYLDSLGIKPNDVPFTIYYNSNLEYLDIEMAYPVPCVVPDKEDMKCILKPSMKVISGIYKGNTKYMVDTIYDEMLRWIEYNHYDWTGTSYEYYLIDSVPEDDAITKVELPIR